MINITTAQALRIAEESFPNAPEELVRQLGINVRYSKLNCDGWCLQLNNHSIIRINSEVASVRQRFTLAHELGHLILGFPSVVGESVSAFPVSASEEEKLVNLVASQILLPEKILIEAISEIPITATLIKKLAKKAKVSELVVARRLATMAENIGLKGALVAFYKDSKFQWQWSETHKINEEFLTQILKLCGGLHPNPARIPRKTERDVIVGSIVKNPSHNTTTVFIQLVHEHDGNKRLSEERRRELEEYIFHGNDKFRMSLNGCFGAFKSKIKGMSLEDAQNLFYEIHLRSDERWGQDAYQRLTSDRGQEYINIRLEELLR